MSVIGTGEKVHVIERRTFESDVRRHFVGEVVATTESVMRVVGWAFVWDSNEARYVRRDDRRTRVIPLAAPGIVLNVLPHGLDVSEVRYEQEGRRMVVTDGRDFLLEINEFGVNR